MAPFMLTCESDFPVAGLQVGEDFLTPIRIVSTLFSFSVTSAWFNWTKVKKLSLFFAHWLSALVIGLAYVVEDMMVTVCWTGKNLEGFIKTLKFVEMSSANMLAITNLAICVNIALIVMSHRSMTRIKSVSSPGLILGFLLISMGLAGASVPFWESTVVLKTAFWMSNPDEAEYTFVSISMFYVEFVVGTCMFGIVAWLLLFRMMEIKECWMIHVRIRYYFGLTVLGTIVNLGLGICGTINVSLDSLDSRLFIWSWMLRYIHICLDTVLLCSVLRDRIVDERSRGPYSSNLMSCSMSSVQGLSAGAALGDLDSHDTARGSSSGSSKPVASAPIV